MIGIIVIIGLLVLGICLYLTGERIEHMELMEDHDARLKRISDRTKLLLDIERVYESVENRWWFKCGIFYERLLNRML